MDFVCINNLLSMNHSLYPIAYSHKGTAIWTNKHMSTRYLCVVVFYVENGISVIAVYGTEMLLCPIGFVQFVKCASPSLFDVLVSIILFHTKKRIMGIIIPKDAHLRFAIIKEPTHEVYHLIVLFFVRVAHCRHCEFFS